MHDAQPTGFRAKVGRMSDVDVFDQFKGTSTYIASDELRHAVNVAVALTVAVIKASLVVLFFMHVRYASTITKLVVISSLVWLGFLFFITLSDYLTRGWLMPPPIPR